jgi:predicted DNA-binding transcriptional regulator AlpA
MLYSATAFAADHNDIHDTTNGNRYRLISAVDLREMFGGVTDMTISRWLKNDKLAFPKPIRIATRRYWYEIEMIEWVRNQPRELSAGSSIA